MSCTHEGTRKNNFWRRFVNVGWAVTVGLITMSQAQAQPLNGSEIQMLARQGTWVAEERDWGYWSWNADNTVCLRVFGPTGDCADNGTWKIDDDVMCYELTWWGEAYDVRINCFTVHALGDDRYEAQYHGGAMVSTFIHFGILE